MCPSRRRLLIWMLVVLALAAAPLWAAPPLALRVNGRTVERVKPDLIVVQGQAMWDVQALLHEIGGTARVEGDHVLVYRGAQYLEMTVGRRQFTVDGAAQQFTLPPLAQGGYIYVPVGEVVCVFNGLVAWDPAGRVVSVEVPPNDVYGGPDPLRLSQPVDGAVVRDILIVEGYTLPWRQIQVDVWRRQDAVLFSWLGQAVYHDVLRSDADGWFRGRVTLTAGGLHRVEAELLNCTGGTNSRATRLIEGLVSGAPPPLPGPPDCTQTSCRLEITSPLHGANLTTDVLEAIGWATVGSTIEVEIRQAIRRLALTRVRPDQNGRWLARVALTHPGLPHTGLYTIRARLFDATGRPQLEQLVTVQLSLPGPPER